MIVIFFVMIKTVLSVFNIASNHIMRHSLLHSNKLSVVGSYLSENPLYTAICKTVVCNISITLDGFVGTYNRCKCSTLADVFC